jgi:hypothetical protein
MFKIDEEALKIKRKAWLKQLGEAQSRQLKCLNKRMFLHRYKNYRLFDVQRVPKTNLSRA